MKTRTRVATASSGALAIAMAFIIQWEGISLKAYQDGVRIWTICVGHTQGAYEGQTATDAECMALYESDVGKALVAVERHAKVSMPDTRRAALASFVFNVGEGSFARSTLLKLLNQGKPTEACHQLRRWVYAGGKKLRGLERRREAETKLCLQ